MEKSLLEELFGLSLYQKFQINKEEYRSWEAFKGQTVRANCPFCRDVSTFNVYRRSYYIGTSICASMNDSTPRKDEEGFITSAEPGGVSPINRDISNIIEICCSMNDSHKVVMMFQVSPEYIMKTGQYPSIADLHLNSKKLYRQLPEEYSSEMIKAIRLFSSGVGVGSFVYLRRVFEYLLEEAYNAITESKISWDDFMRQHMEGKIDTVKSQLPNEIVSKISVYKILSKGIHDLTENECLGYFSTLLKSIELILQKSLSKQLINKQEKVLNAEIAKIQSTL